MSADWKDEHPAWEDDPAVQASQMLTTATDLLAEGPLDQQQRDRVLVAIGFAILAVADELRYLEDTITVISNLNDD